MGSMRLGVSVLLVVSSLVSPAVANAARDPALGRAEAFVSKQCPAAERVISSAMWMSGVNFNALYGNCRAGDGRDQHIWFFLNGRFIGSDTREPFSLKEIFGVWRDDRVIAFMYVLYRVHDSNCCPTGGGKIVRFRLQAGRLVKARPASEEPLKRHASKMIETARLVLRLPEPDDARALLGFVGDAEVMSRLADEPGGIEKAEEVVHRWIARWERNGVGQFVVERNGAPIGRVGLIVWDRRTWETSSYDRAGEHAQEELGWGLVREAWGHGYATEAAQAVRLWAMEKGIRELVSLIATDNVRSQRVAQKLGARPAEEIQSEFGAIEVWTYPVP